MSKEVDISHIQEFLLCRTPQGWLDTALKPENLSLLLNDHAACELKAANSAMRLMFKYGSQESQQQSSGNADNSEKKAASTAMNLVYRCSDKLDLLNKMSKLAREELRHFEQVLAIMKKRKIDYVTVSASRYAAGLHKHVRTWEPAKLTDTLIIGAIIEARSCERFAALAPLLDDELNKFYLSLLKSESRHYQDYLTLANKYAEADINERVDFFLEKERELIESEDADFRFHSGVPASA